MTNLNNTPLREPTFLILLSLAPGPRHGYAILKEVESLSEGRVKMSTGTLYGAIERLLLAPLHDILQENENGAQEQRENEREVTDLGDHGVDSGYCLMVFWAFAACSSACAASGGM